MPEKRSLIADIENAISSGSAGQRVDTLRKITDLFMSSAEQYNDEQVGVFDDVIGRLAERIEAKARAELASRLAPVRNAPYAVVRSLARDQAIEVSGPILTQSVRLTEQDLIEAAQGKSQAHLLAISRRSAISEAVGDMLVANGDREVVRSVARNEGARFSNTGFARLVEKSADDEDLAVSVGLRKDIPQAHFHALVAKASEAVFKKLSEANPAAAVEVKRVLSGLTGRKPAAPKQQYDYTAAKDAFERLRQSGVPLEPRIHEFARQGKFEEVVVALSAMSRLPIPAVERIMVDEGVESDVVLILAKAAAMPWATARLVLAMRRGAALGPTEVETAHAHFERLQPATAQRVVRFYQVRHAAGEKPV
jgi:uncharacterized protein (DUF2336 family)